MSEASDLQERILVLAPAGRDGLLAARALGHAGMTAVTCVDVEDLAAQIDRGAAAAVVTEEALAPKARRQLRSALERQPLWSDFPIVVCAGRPETAAARARIASLAAELGNVTLLDRPIHPEALVGSVRSALRARLRQYQARELLSQLEIAVREREQFLATMSHELRNPLGAIRTSTELLMRALPPGERIGRLMSVLDRQSRHLGRLVDDLLDVSRVTTGKVVLENRRVDLRTVMENVLQQLGPIIAEEGLVLSSALGSAPCHVDGDPVRLEQIFTNLVNNAIKYTPRGGRVSVTLRTSGGQAEVKVADTGVGMSPETLRSVFDLFSQADRSLDRARGGMGIGLTLVRALTELHGGAVSAASGGVGQGSELTVALPLAEEVATGPTEPAPEARPVPPRRILLVEDSPDNREMLQELLEQEGHRVETAPDGPLALQAALRSRPEVSLIDIGLPGMDGYELARRLRAALGDTILLIALTGYGRKEDRQRSAEAGFDCHLTKPLDLDELRHVLWNHATGSAGPRVASAENGSPAR